MHNLRFYLGVALNSLSTPIFRFDPGSQAGARSLEEAWALLLGRLSPVAVIAVQHRSREGFAGDEEAWGGGGVGDTEEERAARRACARAEVTRAVADGRRVERFVARPRRWGGRDDVPGCVYLGPTQHCHGSVY